MKTSAIKKIICIALALILAIAQIPAFAQEETSGGEPALLPGESEPLRTLVYNFRKITKDGNYSAGNVDITAITTFEHTRAGGEFEVFPDSTIVTDPWYYVGKGSNTFAHSKNNNFVIALSSAVGAWGQLAVEVPASGLYQAISVSSIRNDGGMVRVWLAPTDAQNPRAPVYSLGCIDSYSKTQVLNTELKLGTRYIEQGAYILTYEMVGINPANVSTANFRFSEFKLVPAESAPSMQVEIGEVPEIAVTQSVSVDITGTISDGSWQDLYAAEITAEPEDTDIVSAIVTTGADTLTRSLQLTGLSAGTTNINITVTLDGVEVYTVALPVTVYPFGEFAEAEMRVEGTETGRIPIKTLRRLNLSLRDVDGIPIPVESASVRYEVDPADVAQVSADGVLFATGEGIATITAIINVEGVEKSVFADIDVKASGENLLSGINSDFEGEYSAGDWRWQCSYVKPANGDSIPQWGEVRNAPKDGNNDNSAFAVVLNPNVAPTSASTSAVIQLKASESGRIEASAGRLYELSFYMKIEDLTSPDGVTFNCQVDMYGFETSSVTTPEMKLARAFNLKNYLDYPDGFSDWVKVTIPVSAPSDFSETLWITPRIVIRHPNYSTVTHNGYGGVYLFDDFELREVGLGSVEAETQDEIRGFGDTAKVKLSAYSTTGNLISIQQERIKGVTSISSTDELVVYASGLTEERMTDGDFANTSTVLFQPVFTVRAGGKNGSADIIAEITLDGVTERAEIPFDLAGMPNVIRDVDIVPAKSELSPGESTTTQITAVMMDDTSVDMETAEVYYESTKPEIALVSEDGGISAISPGTADIKVYVGVNGVVRYDSCRITVRDDSRLDKAVLGPDPLLIEPYTGKKLSIHGVLESGYKTEFPGTSVSYEIVESEPENAVSVSSEGRVTGLSAGHAKIRARVNYGGEEHISNVISVDVIPREIDDRIALDFTTYQSGNARDATLEKDGWKLNQEKSSPAVLNMSQGFRFQAYGIQAQISVPNTPRDSDTAFDFVVKKSGSYAFFFRGGNYARGALAALYVNERFAGMYDFSNNAADVVNGTTVELNDVYLNAGVNTVTIRSIGSLDSSNPGYIQFPGMILLYPIDSAHELDTAEITVQSSQLAVGEYTYYEAKALTTDAREVFFGNLINGGTDPICNASVTSNRPEIVRVEPDGRLKGLSNGMAEITFSATVGGVTRTDSVSILVEDSDISALSISLSDALYIGRSAVISAAAILNNGRRLENADISYTFTSGNGQVFTVSGNTITATGTGSAPLTARAVFNGKTFTDEIQVTVLQDGFDSVRLSAPASVLRPDSEGVQLDITCLDNHGNPVDMTGAQVSFESDNEQVVTVSETGFVTPAGLGSAFVTATVNIGGVTSSGGTYISVRQGKISRTYYTEDKLEAARENAIKYSWASKEVNTARANADKYVDNIDMLWSLPTPQSLPRSITVGLYNDPDARRCRYCGVDLGLEVFTYPWISNPLNDPWKLKCPICKRRFPSNDFGGFYKLGLDEHGVFNRELAHERNSRLLEDGKDGYLKNTLYPEMGDGWGVDDGFGYVTGRTYPNGVKEVHTYIAYYNHWGVWYTSGFQNNAGIVMKAADALSQAYLLTGEAKYGRAGAILIDRIADLYPDLSHASYLDFSNANSQDGLGRILGRIWEPTLQKVFVKAYDALFPAYDDTYVVNYLKNKAASLKLDNDKSNPLKIRENVENGLLREIYRGCRNRDIYGNFGMHQATLALAAVTLDSQPETNEWIDWILRAPDPNSPDRVSGGSVLPRIVESVDRDGHGLEVAPGYNNIWLTDLLNIADTLTDYHGNDMADIYNHPRIRQMLTSMMPLTINRRVTLPIGHSGRTAQKKSFATGIDTLIKGFLETDDVRAAQFIYFLNGNSVKNLKGDIFTKDPENIGEKVLKVIEEHGEYDFDRSEQLPAYGFSILRRGTQLKSSIEDIDTQHGYYMTYGRTLGHGHFDSLNIGVQAFGLELAPDLGYPVSTTDVSADQWIDTTISHNTVMVDNKPQSKIPKNANPMHFDDDGFVAVMDAEAKKVYPMLVSDYRRTVVMVKVTDEISYGVDFFKVHGGSDHLYSFHAQSDEIAEIKGLNLVNQTMGTYAGPDIPFGDNNTRPLGFSWLNHVRRAVAHGDKGFEIDFKIKDFNRLLSANQSKDLRLRMTVPEGVYLDEVSIARGLPPQRMENAAIPYMEYVLARRRGTDLDSLFTTVFEPYRKDRYLEKIELAPIEKVSGSELPGDSARALKIQHVNGRVDYVVYATNNSVTYSIDNLFEFKGFIGVNCRDENGRSLYSYVQDGEKLDSLTALPAVMGRVVDFTRELTLENSLTVKTDTQVDPTELVGRFVYIENDGTENAAYQIVGAESAGDGKLVLDVGRSSFVRNYYDIRDLNRGFVYNIEKNQRFKIPLSKSVDTSPVFTQIEEKNVDAGSELRFTVGASSPADKALVYRAERLPRGASFDAGARQFKWVPDNGQVGTHYVTICASDGDLETLLNVKINVHGSTKGKPGGNESPGTSPSQPGGPGGSPGDDPGTVPSEPPADDYPVPAERFKDLTGYDWARDDIHRLAERGIIRGTGETTYSPGANITRADFTLLLVRAFGLTSESADNFADVKNEDYFAAALAAAKANGIVTGVGDNRFNPRDGISRQDLFVILERTLKKLGIELAPADASELSGYSDYGDIADYAKSAVATLVKNGIVFGTGDRINPRGRATRAEVAVLLGRLLKSYMD
jgi:hypothetical protein